MSETYEGSVVIYTIEGCPHCKAAKSTLQELKVPYKEILVSQYPPDLRAWLKDRTKKSSVPQIFFNETHVGGNKELNELIQDESRLAALLLDLKENPTPLEGEMALYIPSSTDSKRPDPQEEGLHEFSCEPDEYASLVEDLKGSDIVASNKKGGFFSESVSHSLTGEQLLTWLKNARDVSSDKAEEIGKELLSRKFILKVNHEDEVDFDPKSLYRVQVGADSNFPLNSLDGQTSSCAQRSAVEVGEEMRKVILALFSEYISEDGSTVDYSGIRASNTFHSFKRLTIELQRLDIGKLNNNEKLAFFINIYNALVIHGNIVRGIPVNTWQRYKFFSSTGYNIGGLFFSLNDIENGVLRANRGSAATLFLIPFSSKHDPRRVFSLDVVEPRIHFALNCGARSCPPIKTFTASGILEELQSATAAFLENEDALLIKGNEIHLSKLFRWYQIDFGTNRKEMLEWIQRNTSNEELTALLQSGNYKIRYIDYDWGNNGKKDK